MECVALKAPLTERGPGRGQPAARRAQDGRGDRLEAAQRCEMAKPTEAARSMVVGVVGGAVAHPTVAPGRLGAFARPRDAGRADPSEVFLDGTSIRARRMIVATGARQARALGRSRGGHGTEAVVACDRLGRGLAFVLRRAQAREPGAAPAPLAGPVATGVRRGGGRSPHVRDPQSAPRTPGSDGPPRSPPGPERPGRPRGMSCRRDAIGRSRFVLRRKPTHRRRNRLVVHGSRGAIAIACGNRIGRSCRALSVGRTPGGERSRRPGTLDDRTLPSGAAGSDGLHDRGPRDPEARAPGPAGQGV